LDVSRLFVSPMIRRGELWRLVTSMFPHVGLLHLIFNVYWIWVFGTLVEQVYGSVKTMALILLFAIGSNALEYAFATGGVGLSGVGYGLFGLLWVLSRHDERFRDAVDTRTIQLFVGWFFLCIFLTYAQMMNVGNIAHGSGAVLGFLTGWAISLREHRPFMAGLTAVLLCFGLWGATVGRPGVNLSKWGGYEECRLGYDALSSNHNDEALRWLTESVRYKHIEPGCWANLGIAYQRVGRNSDALVAYRKAAEMGDESAEYGLGLMYERGEGVPRDAQEAIKWYRKAADHGSPVILNDVAWVYATSSDPAIHNPAEALKYATRAVAADKQHPNPSFLDTLAEAQYANGNYEDAIKTEQQAIALASQDQKETFQKSLARYQLAAEGKQTKSE
ncbi:MAG TPA: rhomboid family intramembrane serine protease, partial [Candidatus Angelobacter sp.]